MLPTEVFLSHASQDREMAARIAATLQGHNIATFYAPQDILGAQQWHDEIGAALARCDWFLLLLSPDAVNSKWVKRELRYALRKDRYDDKIVPISYRQCDYDSPSWTLDDFQRVDFTGDFADACRELLRIWDVALRAAE